MRRAKNGNKADVDFDFDVRYRMLVSDQLFTMSYTVSIPIPDTGVYISVSFVRNQQLALVSETDFLLFPQEREL